MKRKKVITTFVAVILIATFAQTTAFAHGHRSGNNSTGTQATTYALCEADGCTMTGVHKHGNTYYAGHTTSGGQAHHGNGHKSKKHHH